MYAKKIGNMYLSSIYEEVADIIDTVTNNTNSLRNKKPTGEIAIPINHKLDPYFYDVSYVYDYKDFFSNGSRSIVSKDNIIKFKVPTHLLLITLCNLAVDITASKLYGVMITANDIRLNPFHPIVANEIIKNYDYYMSILGDSVEVIVYRYNRVHNVNNEDVRYSVDMIEEIISVINKDSYEANTGFHITSYNPKDAIMEHIKSDQKSFGKIELRALNSMQDINSVITPVQMLVYGIVFPYYGIVSSITNNGDEAYQSIDLSYFRSGNINSNSDYVEYVSTCTGEQSNLLYDSLFTLNYMNGHSAYYNNIIADGYAEYAQACIYFSSELFKYYLSQGTSNEEQEK